MVYSTNNEQHLEFRVHNGDWIPVDFDGITLMKRPLAKSYEKKMCHLIIVKQVIGIGQQCEKHRHDQQRSKM